MEHKEDTQRGEGLVRTEAEVGQCNYEPSKAKDCQLPTKAEKRRGRILP